MDVSKLETHDRLQHLKKQEFDIGECLQDIINQKPFGNNPFYVFAHTRTDDDGIKKRLIWQPRLTKPKAQTNSMLFKVYPNSDQVRIIWMIPSPEMWPEYEKGKMLEHDITLWSIIQFRSNRNELEKKESDDLTDEEIQKAYQTLSKDANYKRSLKKAEEIGLIFPSNIGKLFI